MSLQDLTSLRNQQRWNQLRERILAEPATSLAIYDFRVKPSEGDLPIAMQAIADSAAIQTLTRHLELSH